MARSHSSTPIRSQFDHSSLLILATPPLWLPSRPNLFGERATGCVPLTGAASRPLSPLGKPPNEELGTRRFPILGGQQHGAQLGVSVRSGEVMMDVASTARMLRRIAPTAP